MLYRPISEIIARRGFRIVWPAAGNVPGLAWHPGVLTAGDPHDADEPHGSGSIEFGTRPARLLVVEDDWFVGLDMETTLLDSGYEVVGLVRSAEEAVSAAILHQPDLVLMDIRLLGPQDGIDAAREIRQRADIPSLFVSAHADDATRARAADSCPAGWVTKPFLTQHLLEAVERALKTGRGEPASD